MRSTLATCTPRPCCIGFVPPIPPLAGVPGRSVSEKRSENSARDSLNPVVFEFARLLPITSIQLWFARKAPSAAMKEVAMVSPLLLGAVVARRQDLGHAGERHVLAVDAQD